MNHLWNSQENSGALGFTCRSIRRHHYGTQASNIYPRIQEQRRNHIYANFIMFSGSVPRCHEIGFIMDDFIRSRHFKPACSVPILYQKGPRRDVKATHEVFSVRSESGGEELTTEWRLTTNINIKETTSCTNTPTKLPIWIIHYLHEIILHTYATTTWDFLLISQHK